jgi:copper(I)-binding protein
VTRWTRRLLFGALAVLIPALAGCEAGFNAPTLQYHPAAYGATVVKNGISISNLFVLGASLNGTLSPGDQAGAFVGLEALNGDDRLLSVSAPGTASSVKLAGGPVTLTQNVPVLLAGPQPAIVLTGLTRPLGGGQTINLVLNFANAGAVSLEVPVQPRAYEYATFSPPAATPTASPTGTGTSVPSPKATGSQAGLPGGSPSASPSATP